MPDAEQTRPDTTPPPPRTGAPSDAPSEPVVPIAASSSTYTNGHGHMPDPEPPSLYAELLAELRLARTAQREDAATLRSEMVAAQKETTEAIKGLDQKVGALQQQAPNRLSFYLASALILLALISTFAIVATRGVSVADVAGAVKTVVPAP